MADPLLDELEREVGLRPDDAVARHRLAEALFADGDFTRAAQQLERALVLDGGGSDGNARRLLAKSYERAGRSDAARHALGEQLRRDPDDVAAREELVTLLVAEGRIDDALVHAEEAARAAPADPRHHRRAAELYRRKRLLVPARAALERAQRLAPNDAALAEELRQLHLEHGDGAAAARLAGERVLVLERARAALATGLLARATAEGALAAVVERLRAGDVDGAKRALVLAGDEERAGAAWEFVRGELWLAQGDAARAERCYRVALQRAPELAVAHQRLRALAEAAAGSPPAGSDAVAAVPTVGHIAVLGWNPAGGAVSPLEAVAVAGSGQLVCSGNVGAHSREAAQVAFSCLKHKARSLGIEPLLPARDLHLHFADTEIAKEGPSAGLALLLAAVSAFAERPLRARLAATGEITIHGEVRPVGGVHEKLVAARLAGIRTVLLPRRNLRELRELWPEVAAHLEVILVDSVDDAVAAALR
jgi:ATP-dependent Lon protease